MLSSSAITDADALEPSTKLISEINCVSKIIEMALEIPPNISPGDNLATNRFSGPCSTLHDPSITWNILDNLVFSLTSNWLFLWVFSIAPLSNKLQSSPERISSSYRIS